MQRDKQITSNTRKCGLCVQTYQSAYCNILQNKAKGTLVPEHEPIEIDIETASSHPQGWGPLGRVPQA